MTSLHIAFTPLANGASSRNFFAHGGVWCGAYRGRDSVGGCSRYALWRTRMRKARAAEELRCLASHLVPAWKLRDLVRISPASTVAGVLQGGKRVDTLVARPCGVTRCVACSEEGFISKTASTPFSSGDLQLGGVCLHCCFDVETLGGTHPHARTGACLGVSGARRLADLLASKQFDALHVTNVMLAGSFWFSIVASCLSRPCVVHSFEVSRCMRPCGVETQATPSKTLEPRL